MAVNIGPKIGIDGEAEFRKELLNLNQQVKTFGAELKAIASAAEDESNALEKSQRSYETLSRLYSTQEKKLERLNKAFEESADKLGESDTKTLKWKQAVYEATTQLNKLEKELNDSKNALDDFGKEAEDAADNLDEMVKETKDFGTSFAANLGADLVADAIGSVLSGLRDMVEETKEYRKIMGSLEVSSEKAGYTADETAEAYNRLYGVLADDQTAATTLANLQALGMGQEELMSMIDGTIGAWATYGDSIPIDGLAEALNETVKTAEVTGVLADVLNWAGLSEEKFNEQLKTYATETARARAILQLFAREDLVEAGQAWQENNKSLVEANQATANYTAAIAEMGARVEPIMTAFQNSLTAVVMKALELTDGVDWDSVAVGIENATAGILGFIETLVENGDTVLSIISGIGAGFVAWNVTSMITTLIGTITKLGGVLPAIKAGMAAVNAVMAANPIGLVVTAIAALVAAFVTAYNTSDEFRAKVDNVMQFVKETVVNMVEKVKEQFNAVKDFISNVITKIKGFFKNVDWAQLGKDILAGVINGLNAKLGSVISTASSIVSKVKGVFTGKSGFDTHSPSKWSEGVLKNVMEGAARGIANNASLPIKQAGGAVNRMMSSFENGASVPRYANGTAAAYDRMAASMSNLRVVLNDGTLVGKIAPRMDQTLGGYTKVKARYGV